MLVRGEKARIISGEHGGEHPEGILGQLRGRDRAERRGHHGDRRSRGITQIVETDRVHAEGRENPGHLRQFGGGADADGAVAFSGHPVDGPQSFRILASVRQEIPVHLLGDLDERGVGGNLCSVHDGQASGELSTELGGCVKTHDHSLNGVVVFTRYR